MSARSQLQPQPRVTNEKGRGIRRAFHFVCAITSNTCHPERSEGPQTSAQSKSQRQATSRPNSAILRSPRCVTRTTRDSRFRATQPISTSRANSAAPSAPARCGFRSVQSRQRRANVRRPRRTASTSTPSFAKKLSPIFPSAYSHSPQARIAPDDSSRRVKSTATTPAKWS
jgi:hypothetical protein